MLVRSASNSARKVFRSAEVSFSIIVKVDARRVPNRGRISRRLTSPEVWDSQQLAPLIKAGCLS